MKTRPFPLCLPLALLLAAGCTDRAAAEAARVQAQAAADETAAAEAERGFDAAFAEGNWTLARAQGDVLLANWPGTAAAGRVRERHGEARTKAAEAAEAMRVAALWAYNIETVPAGRQLSAAIYARDPLDLDGGGAKPVRLIFRDHPEWGRSSYLVLQAGDFAQACYRRCQVTVTVDDAPPRKMAANRPKTDEAIAMFIDDERTLWALTRDAERIGIRFQTRDVGEQAALFEVGGLDRTKLPGWD